VITSPKASIIKLKDKVTDLYHELSAGSMRVVYRFDPATATFVIVSQVMWEIVESAVMPGGMHFACTAVNTALLGVAALADGGLRLAKNCSASESTTDHVRMVLGMYLTDVWQRYGWIKELEDPAIRYVDQDSQSYGRTITSDFDIILDPQQQAMTRYYVAVRHLRGLSQPLAHLQAVISHLRREYVQDQATARTLEATIGRLSYILAEYTATLTMRTQSRKASEDVRRQNFEVFVQEWIQLYADLDHWIVHALEDKAIHAADARQFFERASVLVEHARQLRVSYPLPVRRTKQQSCQHVLGGRVVNDQRSESIQ
jgi:hypothetical protein